MHITKMHGLGNDFIIIDTRDLELVNIPQIAISLCSRRIGVGADGLLLIDNSQIADFEMRVINSDGSEAQMCGNGIRCAAKYAYDFGIVANTSMTVQTTAGIMKPELVLKNNVVANVRVRMGSPKFSRSEIPMNGEGDALDACITVDAREVKLAALLMGVPHAVVYEHEYQADFEKIAPLIEAHDEFPENINVNFVQIEDEHRILVRTWERGAGRTLACGTGACACTVALCEKGLLKSPVKVLLEHGALDIEYEQGEVIMTGPAAYVFSGEVM